jgi:multiple sugar transport system substrate-binding protein
MLNLRKRKNKTVILFMTILIIVSVALAGCSSKSNTSASPNAKPAEPTPSTQKAEKVTIPFWITPQGDEITSWFKKWTAEFNKTHPNIEVKLEFVAQDAWQQKLKAAQSNGTAPQISYSNYASIPMNVKEGILAPLDDYVDPAIFKDLYPNVNDLISIQGKHYSFPVFVEPYEMLYYRKDFFTEVGLDPNTPPKTWDELISYAQKLTKKGRFGLGIPGSADIGWTHWSFQNMLGHYPISDDWSKATVKDDQYKALFTFWKRLYDEKVVPKQALGPAFEIKPLAEGRVAMQFNGSWSTGDLKNMYKNMVDKIGIAVAPTQDGITDGKTTGAMGGWTLTLDGKAKNPKQAGEFISYLVGGDPKIMLDFYKTMHFSKFAARKSVDDLINQEQEIKDDPFRKLIVEQIIPFAKPEPWYSYDISSIYANSLETVISKGVKVDDALDKLDKDLNDYIKVHNYANSNPRK